jgi:8-oxo-dGTP diphosphatase
MAMTEQLFRLIVHNVVFTLCENRLHVLLCPEKQSSRPERYCLPSASVLPTESLDDTANRLLTEQTGVQNAYLEQLYTYGDPKRQPDERVIAIVYFAIIASGSINTAAAVKKDNRWFSVDALPELIYDHSEISAYALRRLRYKLEYSAVGFELLPEEFTLSELQKTYEIILGEKLDKRNFRRRILEAEIIEMTPHLRSGEGRPARLYRYRPDAVAEAKARRLFP